MTAAKEMRSADTHIRQYSSGLCKHAQQARGVIYWVNHRGALLVSGTISSEHTAKMFCTLLLLMKLLQMDQQEKPAAPSVFLPWSRPGKAPCWGHVVPLRTPRTRRCTTAVRTATARWWCGASGWCCSESSFWGKGTQTDWGQVVKHN